MKEVQVLTWCNVCFTERNEKVPPVVTRTLRVDEEEAEVDLCEPDDKALDAIRALIRSGDTTQVKPVPQRRRSAERVLLYCPVPTCRQECWNRTGLGAHAVKRHGEKLEALEARYGKAQPVR